jgi:hypothetical protein
VTLRDRDLHALAAQLYATSQRNGNDGIPTVLGSLHTEDYKIDGGGIVDRTVRRRPHDMAAHGNLAAFVARTLENARTAHAAQTWVELVDHGAGDGGGLEADHGSDIIRADDIAGAIADGVALHAKEHPEDAQRKVDGLVTNQCLMATLGFASALSHAGDSAVGRNTALNAT